MRDEVVNLTVAAFHVVVVKSIKSAAAAICAISTSRCSLHNMDLFFFLQSQKIIGQLKFFPLFFQKVFFPKNGFLIRILGQSIPSADVYLIHFFVPAADETIKIGAENGKLSYFAK